MAGASRLTVNSSAKVLLFEHKKGDKLSPLVAFLSPCGFL